MNAKFPAAPNRRSVLAFIALADAPMPEQVKFSVNPTLEFTDTVWMYLDSGADVQVWAALLGIKLDRDAPLTTNDGSAVITSATSSCVSGWHVTLWATDEASQHRAAIDDETRAALEAVSQ